MEGCRKVSTQTASGNREKSHRSCDSIFRGSNTGNESRSQAASQTMEDR